MLHLQELSIAFFVFYKNIYHLNISSSTLYEYEILVD